MINKESFTNMGVDEKVELQHPYIDGLSIVIQRDTITENFLGQSVILANDNYVVEDNDDKVRPHHGVSLELTDLLIYIEKLMNVKSIQIFRYIRNMQRYSLSESDVIEFKDGKRGMIIIPDYEIYTNNVQYKPINKDGSLSKSKPRILYGNSEFFKIDKE